MNPITSTAFTDSRQRRPSAISDAWTIAKRDLQHWLQRPENVVIGWLFPIMIVLMFGGLFGGAIRVPEDTSYFEFLMPGMFAMTMLFGLETTVLAVAADAAKGVTDRFRSLPIHAGAIVLGRCIADMLNSIVGLAIVIVAGLLLGWRWHHGWLAALAAVGLLLLLRFSFLWIGVYIGLHAKGPEAAAPVQILVWPVGFLSSVFVDPTTMPTWLGSIAAWNPLSAAASAARALFGNPGFANTSWVAQHGIGLTIAWCAVLVSIFLPLSVRKFRHLNR